MQKKEKNTRKGFTLVELIVVLVTTGDPCGVYDTGADTTCREVWRHPTFRGAGGVCGVLAAVTEQDRDNMSKTVKLKQKQDDWQSKDPITIAGITHCKTDGNTENWKGIPRAENAKCTMTAKRL